MPDQMKATLCLLVMLSIIAFMLTNPAKLIGLGIIGMIYLLSRQAGKENRGPRRRTRDYR